MPHPVKFPAVLQNTQWHNHIFWNEIRFAIIVEFLVFSSIIICNPFLYFTRTIAELFLLFVLTFFYIAHIIISTHLTCLEGESGFRIAITGFLFFFGFLYVILIIFFVIFLSAHKKNGISRYQLYSLFTFLFKHNQII